MAGEKAEPVGVDEHREELTKEELLRLAWEALARSREHGKRFLEILERLEKRTR
jgi:hypothetical protein